MTNKEKQDRAKLGRWLRENGVSIEVDDSWQDSIVQMRQLGRQSDSQALDLGNGATGYVIMCNILLKTNSILIVYIDIECPWSDGNISLIPDPIEIARGYSDYRLYGRRIVEIEREHVLNHVLVRNKLFRRGAAFQGLILWTGIESIPSSFVHGDIVPATVAIYDQFETCYRFQFSLWIDRRRRCSTEKQVRYSKPSLLSQRDPSVPLSAFDVGRGARKSPGRGVELAKRPLLHFSADRKRDAGVDG
jgi:hypothetical protein